MVTLRAWLADHMMIVRFVYGLSFFSLGLLVSMQPRAQSRYRLAKGLWALAAFAFIHAAADWGMIFVPSRGPHEFAIVATLRGLRTMLGAISFGFLLHFGLNLLRSENRRWLAPVYRFTAPALTMIWTISFFLYPLVRDARVSEWYWMSEVWSRYMLGMPACILVALGLIRQVNELTRDRLHNQVRSLYTSVFFFVLYGLTAGVVVPHQPFWPASVINAENFFTLTQVPVEIFRAAAAIGVTFCTVRMLAIFKIETTRRLHRSEEERILLQERERIARELHDGILQTLYGVGLGLRDLGGRMENHSPDPGPAVGDLTGQLNNAISDLRRAISTLRDDGLRLADLVPAVREVAEQIHRLAGLPVELEVDGFDAEDAETAMTAGFRDHILALLREGLSNAVRHSGADEVSVMLALEDETVFLRITDNGTGFDPEAVMRNGENRHHGLRNMSSRVEQLGGTVRILSSPRAGTRLLFYLPLPTEGVNAS